MVLQVPAPAPLCSAIQRWIVPASLIALCGGILVASFLKSDWANNDFERFNDLRLLFLFFALFAGLCAVYVAAYRLRLEVSPRALAATTAVSSLLLLAAFPVGSKDIFAYSFFGKLWGLYHKNPYIVTLADVPADPWQPFVQARWRNLPAAYGPVFLWQARAIYVLTTEHLWAAVWLHKAVATSLLFASLWLARALLRSTAPDVTRWSSRGCAPATAPPGCSPSARSGRAVATALTTGWCERAQPRAPSWQLVLLAWNPLLPFESANGGHNDIAMVLLLLGALECWRRRRPNAASGLLALSIWYKWYGIIFVPAFLLETFKADGWRAASRQATVWVAFTLLAGMIFLGPLPGSWPAVLGQLMHPGAMTGIYITELSPPLAACFWTLKAFGLFDSAWGVRLFDAARVTLFVVAAVLILVRQWTAAPSLAALVESCCLFACAFFLLLITMLLPWHLLSAIVLGLVAGREPFLLAAVVLTVLALLSYFLTFAVATLMLGVVLGALWLLRHSQTVMVRAVSGGG